MNEWTFGVQLPADVEKRLIDLTEFLAMEECLVERPWELSYEEVLKAVDDPEHPEYEFIQVWEENEYDDRAIVANRIENMRMSFVRTITLTLSIVRTK